MEEQRQQRKKLRTSSLWLGICVVAVVVLLSYGVEQYTALRTADNNNNNSKNNIINARDRKNVVPSRPIRDLLRADETATTNSQLFKYRASRRNQEQNIFLSNSSVSNLQSSNVPLNAIVTSVTQLINQLSQSPNNSLSNLSAIASIIGVNDSSTIAIIRDIIQVVNSTNIDLSNIDPAAVSTVISELDNANVNYTNLDFYTISETLSELSPQEDNNTTGSNTTTAVAVSEREQQVSNFVTLVADRLFNDTTNTSFANATTDEIVNLVADLMGIDRDNATLALLREIVIITNTAVLESNSTDIDSIVIESVTQALLDQLTQADLDIALQSLNNSTSNDVVTFNSLVRYLSGLGVLSSASNVSDYQVEAVEWLVNDINSGNTPFFGDTTNENFVEIAYRYVLASLYYATDGRDWRSQLNFLSRENICNWTSHFNVRQATVQKGVICNNNRQVVSLVLDSNRLSGNLPAELSFLQRLQQLDVSLNFVKGPIPDSFCRLSDLQQLAIAFNQISGVLPDCIGSLTDLTFLFLSNNLFTGELPESFVQLSKLQYVFMDDNMFSGDVVAVLDNMPDLTELFAEDNNINSVMREGVFANSSVTQIDLSNNRLFGTLPESLLASTTLQLLDVNSNELRGRLPEVRSPNSNMLFLSLYNNNFWGRLPRSWTQMNNLFHLDLANNQLRSSIPVYVANMTSLEYLFLSNNNFFRGRLPNEWATLTDLKELGMKGTNLIGTIPEWLGTATQLKLLDLDNNRLDGRIPNIFGNMQELEFVLLNRNEFVGRIPSSLESLTQLRLLFLDNTDIIGSLDGICNLPAFQGPANDVDGIELLTADCGGENPMVTCSCCSICCDPQSEDDCNPFQLVASLNPMWEDVYRRSDYQFGNGSRFADRDYFNLNL